MSAVAMSATATSATTGTRRRIIAAAGAGRGEDGKLLGQFFRPAVRAGGSLPIAGAHEDFAVALALFAMEFVNRHEGKITRALEMYKRRGTYVIGRAVLPRRLDYLGLRGSAALPNYGDNFSRCGRWSRFQRTKAASLVSSKRNFSAGDSSWPSQNTTLALP